MTQTVLLRLKGVVRSEVLAPITGEIYFGSDNGDERTP